MYECICLHAARLCPSSPTVPDLEICSHTDQPSPATFFPFSSHHLPTKSCLFSTYAHTVTLSFPGLCSRFPSLLLSLFLSFLSPSFPFNLFDYQIHYLIGISETWNFFCCANSVAPLCGALQLSIECRTRNRNSPGSNPFATVSKFGHLCALQLTQLYNWVPGYRRQLKCEWIVFARNCCVARIPPREVKLVSEWTGLPGGEV